MALVGQTILGRELGPYSDHFILIGGAACAILFDEVGREFRATKDFDILIIHDGDSLVLLNALSQFIINGQYSVGVDAGGQHRHFRFLNPQTDGYPVKLELCARRSLSEDATRDYFPIARPSEGEDLLSLSAILLDEHYYLWLMGGQRMVAGLPIAEATHLIPLKILAWKNLNREQQRGKRELTKKIKKHRLDCLRLLTIIPRERQVPLPPDIKEDVQTFHDAMMEEYPGLPPECKYQTVQEWMGHLASIYQITAPA